MKIQCPQCAVRGSVDEAYRGKKVKCPKCGEIFVVFADSLQIPVTASPPPPPFDAMAVSAESDPPVALEDIVAPGVAAIEPAITHTEPAPADQAEVAAEPLADEGETAPPAVEGEDPLREPEETIDWSDLVSELDKEPAQEDNKVLEEDIAPAGLHQGLESSPAPAVDSADVEPSPDIPPTPVVDEPLLEEVVEKVDVKPVAGQDVPLAAAAMAGGAALAGATERREVTEKIVLEGVEQRPYGMEKEQCWQCGKEDRVGVPFIAKDGRLYCPDCLPVDPEETRKPEATPRQPQYGFSITGLLREAWVQTKGVKGAIWAGSAIMYLAVIVIVAGGALLLPQSGSSGWNPLGMVVDLLFQLANSAVMVLFSAGLINMGLRKVAGEAVGWRMVFDGFPVAANLVVAGILQTLLILIGFLLLILPGIYLSVGYCLAIPLIIDRKMSPWQALETSRKAVHGEWWKIFGLFIAMGLLAFVASIPLGIGLIWVWPMWIVLIALVYRALFGIARKAE